MAEEAKFVIFNIGLSIKLINFGLQNPVCPDGIQKKKNKY